MERSSGILMHIGSLPSPYGIGTFGKAAYEFADSLKSAGQKYWQVLPLGPTSFGDSPYQSFSTFAGNPYFIDLTKLCEDGLLEESEIDGIDWGGSVIRIDYAKLYQNRFKVLEKAFDRGYERDRAEVEDYCGKNRDWLMDYALFMALKQEFDMQPWTDWPDEGIKYREAESMAAYRIKLKPRIQFWMYCQYLFHQQWEELKSYVHTLGIGFIGDIPIYVALDSADVWANRGLFLLVEKCIPTALAGCPPDYFSEDGQLWGNPIYDWKRHEQTGYSWWIKRIKASLTVFDVLRIDHFRGFASYYKIPFGEKTARIGSWEEGPGIRLFEALEASIGRPPIIAEDLGHMTPDVKALLAKTGFPGMKVLQFAFDSREHGEYLPHAYDRNCVVYTGTHDNATSAEWFDEADTRTLDYAREYLGLNEEEGYSWGLLRGAWGSVADLAIAPLQDILGLDGSSRMNTPSTLGGNWEWRLDGRLISRELCWKIAHMTKMYGR